MKKQISFFIVVLLFLLCATAVSAAEWEAKYWLSTQGADGKWSSRSKNQYVHTTIVSGFTITSVEDAKNEVRKGWGGKKGQDTFVLKDPLQESPDQNCRIQWISVGKTLKEDNKQKAPKEPKKDWVDKNLPPLKL